MIPKLKRISCYLGIDGAVAYTVLARLVQGSSGIISILFIARYLNKVEQGYYYTFSSLIAVQIFFELGLSNIITQFVAHEKAHLSWANTTELEGSPEALSRLSSLLHFCVRWFSIIAIMLFGSLIILGYVFFYTFNGNQIDINWQTPWIILSITTALSLTVSPVLAFFEGLGKVKEVSKIRLFQQSFQLLALYLFFVYDFKLLSAPFASFISFLVAPLWVCLSYKRKLLNFIWKALNIWKVNYKVEIFPYQWRIALSWVSGYFIFQLFNPVLFATEGPAAAGQMGMTLAVLNGLTAISLSWINTKVPILSELISRKEYFELDKIFNQTLKQICFISFISLCILYVTIVFMQHKRIPLGNRFLPKIPLTLLFITTFVNQIVYALATYLRCHKQEPFLMQSIVMGILTAVSTFVFGNLFGVMGITIGYSFLIVFVSLFWSLLIFKSKKISWHQ